MNRKGLKRSGAAALALQLFLANGVFAYSAEKSVYEERASNRLAKASLLASLPASLPFISPSVPSVTAATRPASTPFAAIDATLGTVRSISVHSSSTRAVTYIQDVHGNEEAQRRIAGVVSGLIDGNRIDALVLEGAAGTVSLNPFRSPVWPDSARRAAEGLLSGGRISGALFAAATAKREIPVIGAENAALYERNVAAVRRAEKSRDAVTAMLTDRSDSIERAKEKTFSPALREFDRIVEGRAAGTVSVGQYAEAIAAGRDSVPSDVTAFLTAARLETQINQRAAESERAALLAKLSTRLSDAATRDLVDAGLGYRTGRLKASDFYRRLSVICSQSGVSLSDFPEMDRFIRYVLLADSLDMDALARSFERLEQERYARLAATPAERDLVAASAALRLQRSLVDFSLSAEEWARYQPAAGRNPLLRPFEDFYVTAELRNRAIVQAVQTAMRRHGGRVALVTGGFHSRTVTHALSDMASVATFVPRMTSVDEHQTKAALSVFAQEKQPLDRLFEGEKLFLAPPPAPRSAQVAAPLMTAADALRNGAAQSAVIAAVAARTEWTPMGVQNGVETVRFELGRDDGRIDVAVPFVDDTPTFPVLRKVTPAFRSYAMNSTWVMAPLLTVLTVYASSLAGVSMNGWQIGLSYYVVRMTLTLSVAIHEMGHLNAAGKMAGKSDLEKLRLMMDSLIHHPNADKATTWDMWILFTKKVLLGTDITDAWIRADTRTPREVEKVAEAGPMWNISLAVFGLTALLVGGVMMGNNVPVVSVPLAVLGFIFLIVNVVLLGLNAWGTDYRAWRTGIAPDVYRMGPAPSSNEAWALTGTIENFATPAELNDGRIQPFLEEVRDNLGDQKPNHFDGIVFPVVLQTILAAMANGPVRRPTMRASLDNSDLFHLKLTFEEGRVLPAQQPAIDQFKEAGWTFTWSDPNDAGPTTLTISAPLSVSFTIDGIPNDGEDLTGLLREMGTEKSRHAREMILGGLRSIHFGAPMYFSPERLRAFLWIDDAEIFRLTAQRILGRGNPAEMAVLAEELHRIMESTEAPAVKRRAEWMLGLYPGLSTDAEWQYARLATRALANGRILRVSVTTPGEVDLIVQEPLGVLGYALKLIRLFGYPKRTVTTIRLTNPGLTPGVLKDADANWLKGVQLSFPNSAPDIQTFNEVVRLWASDAAPVGTILEMEPVALQQITEAASAGDTRWNLVLRAAGFKSSTRHLGVGAVSLLKTDAAGPVQEQIQPPLNSNARESLLWSLIVFGVKVGLLIPLVRFGLHWWTVALALPFLFVHWGFRDEAWHRFVGKIMGQWDHSDTDLIFLFFGIGEPTTRLSGGPSEEFYQKYPWLRSASTIAPVVGFLVFGIIAGALLYLNSIGAINVGPWWELYLWVEAGMDAFVVGIAVLLYSDKYADKTDFWRWIYDLRHPPVYKPREKIDPSKQWKEYFGSLFLLRLTVTAALIRGIEKLQAQLAARSGVRNFMDDIRRDLAAGPKLSDPLRVKISARAQNLVSRFIENQDLVALETMQNLDWKTYAPAVLDPRNPLIGALPRQATGAPISDEDLQTYFTEDGWRSFLAFRSGDWKNAESSQVLRHSEGHLQLTLSALRSDRVEAFFAAVGKPDAALAARTTYSGREADVVILDSVARPWNDLPDGARIGSVTGAWGRMSAAQRAESIRRVAVRHAVLVAAAALVVRSGDAISESEREKIANALYDAMNPDMPPLANIDPFNVAAVRDERMKAALEIAASINIHDSVTLFLNGMKMAFAPLPAQAPVRNPDQTPLNPKNMTFIKPAPGPGSGTSGRPGFAAFQIMGVNGENSAAPSGDQGTGLGDEGGAAPVLPSINASGAGRAPSGSAADRAVTGAQETARRDRTGADNRDQTARSNQGQTTNPADNRENPTGERRTTVGNTTTGTGSNSTTDSDAASNAGRATTGSSNIFGTASANDAASSAANRDRTAATMIAGARAKEPNGTSAQTASNAAATNAIAVSGTNQRLVSANGVTGNGAGQTMATTNGNASAMSRANASTALNGTRPTAAARTDLFIGANAFPANRAVDNLLLIAASLAAGAAAIAFATQSLGLPQLGLPALAIAIQTAAVALLVSAIHSDRATITGTISPLLLAPSAALNASVPRGIGAAGFAPFSVETSAGAPAATSSSASAAERIAAAIASAARAVALLISYAAPRFVTTALPTAAAIADRIARSASVATFDAAVAILSERRQVSNGEAVGVIANGAESDEEKAMVSELAKAAREGARRAILASIAARVGDRRAEAVIAEADAVAAPIELVLSDIASIAKAYAPRQGVIKTRMDEDRTTLLKESAARGRALLALERAWAKEIMTPTAVAETRGKPVRVLTLKPSATGARRGVIIPGTRGVAPKVERGALRNQDLDGLRATGRQNGAAFVGSRLALDANEVLVRADDGRLSNSDQTIVASFASVAGNAGALAVGGESVDASDAEKKAAASADQRPAQGDSDATAAATPVEEPLFIDAAAALPAPSPIEALSSGLKRPAAVVATVTVVALAGAAVAFSLGGAIAAVLTAVVVGLIALSARFAKWQKDLSDKAPKSTKLLRNATAPADEPNLRYSDEEIGRLADIVAGFILGNSRINTANGARAFAALLPEVGSVGLGDQRVVSGVSGFTAAETRRLWDLVSDRLRAAGVDKRPSTDAAKIFLGSLVATSGGQDGLTQAVADKNLFYPVRKRATEAEWQEEMAGVKRLLPLLDDGKKLFIGHDISDDLDPRLQESLKDAIAKGLIVLLPQTSDLFMSRSGHDILSLAALDANLSNLTEDQARNLVVLIPDRVGWDDNLPAGKRSVLDLLGFVLMRDFVAGIPVDRMALRNLGRLAEIIATQA